MASAWQRGSTSGTMVMDIGMIVVVVLPVVVVVVLLVLVLVVTVVVVRVPIVASVNSSREKVLFSSSTATPACNRKAFSKAANVVGSELQLWAAPSTRSACVVATVTVQMDDHVITE